MKKSILKITFLGLIVAATITSCNSSSEKVENAKADVVDANVNLNKAIQDSINEYKKFKTASEMRIDENEKKIAELKEQIKAEKAETRSMKESLLTELAIKNAKLKANIAEYKETGKDKWDAFKLSFNKDLDEVGKSISTMAETNIKNNKN